MDKTDLLFIFNILLLFIWLIAFMVVSVNSIYSDKIHHNLKDSLSMDECVSNYYSILNNYSLNVDWDKDYLFDFCYKTVSVNNILLLEEKEK